MTWILLETDMVFLGVGLQGFEHQRVLTSVIGRAMGLLVSDPEYLHQSHELVIGQIGKRLLCERKRINGRGSRQMQVRADYGMKQERDIESLNIMANKRVGADEIKELRQSLIDIGLSAKSSSVMPVRLRTRGGTGTAGLTS